MTLPVIRKQLSIYPKISSFCIAGLGEPTLCKNFTEIVDYLISQGKFVGIITNGTNIEPILKLKRTPSYISISLNGYDEDSYLRHAGVNKFKDVIDNYRKIKARFPNTGFSYILTRENYMDLGKVIELCDKLEPSFLHLHNYLVYDTSLEDEVEKILKVEDESIIIFIEKVIKDKDYEISKPTLVDFKTTMNFCKSYNTIINLDGEGNVGGCQRQIPPSEKYGNIFKDKDPFNTKQMKRLRKIKNRTGRAHEECKYCFGNWGG